MKSLAIAVVALFAHVSGQEVYNYEAQQVDYEYDPVRAQRAKAFYKDLAVTKIKNFNADERTEFLLNQVGGQTGQAVCQGFDDYALFDFKKLDAAGQSGDKKIGVVVIKEGEKKEVEKKEVEKKEDEKKVVDKKEEVELAEVAPKIAFVYRVCGSSFDPQKKKDKLNSDVATLVDDSSCKDLAENSKTIGNAYLVKDGKCVQSFKGAKFSAEITSPREAYDFKVGEKEVLKHTSKLTYTSRQKCSEDNTKDFTVEIVQKCTGEKEPALTKKADDACSIQLEFAGSSACYIQYIAITKYMAMVAPFFGAIFIIIGLVMCFHGSKFIVYMIAMLIGFAVTGFCFMLGYNFLDSEKAKMMHLIILLIVAIIFGIVGSIAAFYLAKDWAITVLAFWLGILIALLILKLAQVQDQKITLVAAAVGGVLGAVMGKRLNDTIKQSGTAFIGAYLVVRGAAMYIGNYPSEFEAADAKVLAQSGEMLYYTIGYFVVFIILTCAGFIYQRRAYPGEKEGDEMDNEDEARVCGIF